MTLSNFPNQTTYVTRIGDSGEVMWARQLSGDMPGSWSVSAIATGPDHVLYVALSLIDPPDLIALKKLDAAGTTLWVRLFAVTDSNTQIQALAVDADGTVLVTGELNGPFRLGGAALTGVVTASGPSYPDAFAARLDAEGRHLWSVPIGGPYYQGGQSVAVSAGGHIAIAGQGSLETAPAVTHDPWFVALLKANGQLTWSRSFAGRINNRLHVAFDADDVVVAAGFEETLDLGDGVTPSVGGEDVFVARFDGTGNLRWKRALGGDYHEGLSGLAVDRQGSIVFSGFSASLVKPLNLGGPDVTVGTAGLAAFIGKLDSVGNHVWTRIIPDVDDGAVYSPPACAVDAQGAVHVAGQSTTTPPAIYVGKFAP